MGELDQSDERETRIVDVETLEELGRQAVELPGIEADVLAQWAYSAGACDTEVPADVQAAFDALDAVYAGDAPVLV